MQPLVSIIIPVYNAEAYIEKCLLSLINQTYKNLEIIVINDGSIDDSENIIKKIIDADDRIFLISGSNGGVSFARNRGIKKANGDYIVFVDADDYVENDYVEVLYSCIKNKNTDVAICNFVINDEVRKDTLKTKTFTSKDAIIDMLLARNFDSSVCCKIIKSDLAKSELFCEKLSIAEDMLYYYNIFGKCKNISYIDKTCYHYMQNDNGAISTVSDKKAESLDIFKELISNCHDRAIRESLCSKYVSTCFHLLSLDVSKLSEPKIRELKNAIKKYRFSLPFKKHVKFKVRVACILSLFGFNIVNFIMKIGKGK